MKTEKKHLNKFILTIFYLLAVSYGQCYATIHFHHKQVGPSLWHLSIVFDDKNIVYVLPRNPKKIAYSVFDISDQNLVENPDTLPNSTQHIINASPNDSQLAIESIVSILNNTTEETSIELSGNIDLNELKSIFKALLPNPMINNFTLREANINHNKLKMIPALLPPSITYFAIVNAEIDNKSAKIIATFLNTNRTIKTMSLPGYNITTEGIQAIFSARINNLTLHSIDFQTELQETASIIDTLFTQRTALIDVIRNILVNVNASEEYLYDIIILHEFLGKKLSEESCNLALKIRANYQSEIKRLLGDWIHHQLEHSATNHPSSATHQLQPPIINSHSAVQNVGVECGCGSDCTIM